MKKVAFALALWIALSVPLCTFALSDSTVMYDLDGVLFITSLPPGWDVINVDTTLDAFTENYDDWEYAKSQMQAASIYAVALSPQRRSMIFISFIKNAEIHIGNINFTSDEEILRKLNGNLSPQEAQDSVTVVKFGLYKYARLLSDQGGLQTECFSAFMNGYRVNISQQRPTRGSIYLASDVDDTSAFLRVVKTASFSVGGVCAALLPLPIVLAGALLSALLTLLLLRRKKTLSIPKEHHDHLSRFGGMLILLLVWVILCAALESMHLLLSGGWFTGFLIFALLLMGAALPLGPLRRSAFPCRLCGWPYSFGDSRIPDRRIFVGNPCSVYR